MADNVFRVEVGANIGRSTILIKQDINTIFKDINKNPTKIKLMLDRDATKQQIEADLEQLSKQLSPEVTIRLNGGGSLKSGSGQQIMQDINKITSAISRQQAAKITLHLDVAASQKAMMAELKKLNLGVQITPKNGGKNNNNPPPTPQAEYKSLIRDAGAIKMDILKKTARKDILDGGTKEFAELESQITRLQTKYDDMLQKFVNKHGQSLGITDKSAIDAEIDGLRKIEKLRDEISRKKAHDKDNEKKRAGSGAQHAAEEEKEYKKLGEVVSGSSKEAVGFKTRLDDLHDSLKNGRISLSEYHRRLGLLKKEMEAAGYTVESAGAKFSKMLGNRIGYATIAAALLAIRHGMHQIYTNVVNLDTAMTELKKVTNETDETYRKFLEGSASRAKDLGATLIDTVNATASFARLGYTLNQSADLADAALVYKNVGDGIANIDEASESVIATMQAFQIEASDAMKIVDKFNEVGNNFAISSKGVGDALLRSAAAMNAANNTLDETVALAAAANTVVQDPEKVGTVMKTLSMFLRAAKTEAEEAGESTDGMAGSVSELREEILKLTGQRVDIQLDQNTFKSSYQILKEISQVWDKMTDISQANLLEMLGGKRNANVVAALVENFDIAERALVDSQNAAGSALKENEKYLDSINGKIDQMKASYEVLSSRILSSSVIKGIVDALKAVLEFFNKLDSATGGTTTKIITFAALFVMVRGVISAFTSKVQQSGTILNAFFGLFTKDGVRRGIMSIALKISLLKNAISTLIQTIKTSQTFSSFTVLPMLGKIGIITSAIATIGGVIYLAVQSYKGYVNNLSHAKEDLDEVTQKVNELTSAIETNKSRIEELQDLKKAGSISLVEQDELTKLEHENTLLGQRLAIEERIQEAQKKVVSSKAASDLGEFVGVEEKYDAHTGQVIEKSGYQIAQEDLEKYRSAERQYQEEYLKGERANQKLLKKYDDQRLDALDALSSSYEKVSGLMLDIDWSDPKNAGLLSSAQTLLDQIDLAIGGAEALGNIWDNIWSDERSYPGITKARDELIAAANDSELAFRSVFQKYFGNALPEIMSLGEHSDTAKRYAEQIQNYTPITPEQISLKEELEEILGLYEKEIAEAEKLGVDLSKPIFGNIDTSSRQVIEWNEDLLEQYRDVLMSWEAEGANWEEVKSSFNGTVSTVVGQSAEFNGIEIAFSPILQTDAGPVFLDRNTLIQYINGLMQNLGDNWTSEDLLALDAKGLEIDGKIIKNMLAAVGDEARSTGEKMHFLGEDGAIIGLFKGLTSGMQAAGIEVKTGNETFDALIARLEEVGISFADLSLEEIIKLFGGLGEQIEETAVAAEGLTASLEKFVEKQDLITSAQKEFSETGSLSAKTLSSMAEQFPSLKDSIDLYILGLKSGKALLAEMSSAYQADVSNYKKSLVSKAQASPEFFNKLTANQKKLIDELAKSYGVDLENFKTLEQKKVEFQSKIIAQLAKNYSQYTGASLEGLYGNLEVLRQRIMAEKDDKRQRELIKEKMAVQAAILQTKKFTEALDSIALDSLQYNPEKFVSSSSDSKSKGTDKHKEAAEKEIAALKHKYEIEKITAEQYYDGLEDIEKRYYLNSEQNRAKYVEEIRAIDEELFNGRREILKDWLNDQEILADKASASGNVKSQTGIYRGMIDRIKKMIDAAYAYGLDASSDYIQELENQIVDLQQNILDAMRGSYDDFISHMDDFDLWKSFDFSKFDVLKRELKEVIALYEQGLLTWQQYVDARNEIAKNLHDTRRDSLETILDMTMEMIKQEGQDQIDALDKQIDAYQKIIDLKKKLLQDASDEKKHEQEVADLVKSIAELQSKIAQLSLDDSREAAAKRAELEQQLHDKQKELADLQGDYTLDQTLDVLDKSQEAFEDEKEAEKDAVEDSIDSWQELYEKAIERINGDWDGLYKDLMKYEMEHRNSIDGPDSLVTAWKNATSAMQEYNNNFEDAYNGTGKQDWINPNVANDPEAKKILEQMKSNSEIAKQMGTSQVGGKNLHKENQDLADRFYALTGRKLVYNNGWRLDYENGELAYQIGSVDKAPSKPSVSKPQPSGGTVYAATKEKYGAPPSGTLKVGSKGEGVKWLQYFLKQMNLFPYAVDGTFYTRTEDALKAFQRMAGLNPDGIYGPKTKKVLPNYHTGGIVTNAGSIGNGEVLAVLKTGEWVLDDQRKQNLKEMFAGIKSTISALAAGNLSNRVDTMRPSPAVVSAGDTFAPNISVSITHSGEMKDSDAKRYGQEIADTALERLKNAFTKRGI